MASTAETDPKFIQYLLDPEEEYEFYYIVGNGKKNSPVERIGVVKKMLVAHSPVFRRELQESKLKDKSGTEITDIFPSTFRNMLRYIYGYNNTDILSFEDADDLLYVADKYMMAKLQQLLSSRLMELLTPENICSLLNNPAVYRVLELNREITRVIQTETNKVLSSPHFLGMNPDALLKILEQQQLQAPEIELWRSAIKWARSRVGSEDGPTLRLELVKPLEQIRVCALPLEDFCREVAPTKILTDAEVVQVCVFHGTKNMKPELRDICSITEPRGGTTQHTQPRDIATRYEKLQLLQVTLPFLSLSHSTCQSVFEILTKDSRLELTSLLMFHDYSQCNISISIAQTNSTAEPVIVERRNLQPSGRELRVPVSEEEKAVLLLPNTRYKLKITCSQNLRVYSIINNSPSYSGSHFDVLFSQRSDGCYYTCVCDIDYKTLTVK